MVSQNNNNKNWQDQTFSHLGLFFLGNYKFVRSVGKMSHYRARCSNKTSNRILKQFLYFN